MLKMATSAEESVEGIADEDDDITTEEITYTENPEQTLSKDNVVDQQRVKKPRKAKKRQQT